MRACGAMLESVVEPEGVGPVVVEPEGVGVVAESEGVVMSSKYRSAKRN